MKRVLKIQKPNCLQLSMPFLVRKKSLLNADTWLALVGSNPFYQLLVKILSVVRSATLGKANLALKRLISFLLPAI
ncbi:hypothetical protein D3C72_2004390 [compost metagenome]